MATTLTLEQMKQFVRNIAPNSHPRGYVSRRPLILHS